VRVVIIKKDADGAKAPENACPEIEKVQAVLNRIVPNGFFNPA